MSDTLNLLDETYDAEKYSRRTEPYSKSKRSQTVAVGTTALDEVGGRGVKHGRVYRKKVSGGTVTSVKLQGRANEADGWTDLLTIPDDTQTEFTCEDRVGTTIVSNPVKSWHFLRLEAVIATSDVVMDWDLHLEVS